MIEQAVRVRVDVPGRGRVDVVAPTEVPVSALVPEIFDIAGVDADGSWRLRLPCGTTADPDSTLSSLRVRHGDRLELVDELEQPPEPLIIDVSDVLADGGGGVGVVDQPVSCAIAAVAVVPLAVAVYLSARESPVTTAGVAGVLLLVVTVALFVGARRSAPPAVIGVLSWQVAVLSASVGVAVAGTGPDTWECAAGVALGLVVAAALTGASSRTASASAAAGAFGAAVVAALHFWTEQVWAVSVTVGLLALVAAPTVAVTFARVRVPAVPAAGEPFPEEDHSGDPRSAAASAGSLLDGCVAGTATFTTVAGAVFLLGDPGGWGYALAGVAVLVMLIQSRGHARKIPSAALLVGASVTVAAAAWHFWSVSLWPVALLAAALPMGATALSSLSGDGVTPLTRRLVEIVETAAIAASIPLAAVIAEVPRLLQAVLA